MAVAVAVAVVVVVVVARVVARPLAVAAAATVAMSGRPWWRTCESVVEGCRSNNNPLIGLRCSAWVTLLGSLCLACFKARLLTCWLALRAHDAGQRRGGGQGHLLQ